MQNIETFQNKDLVLQVNESFNQENLNLNKYEPFLDALCSTREYQKEAIRTTIRYLLGKRYHNLLELVRENYELNPILREKYSSISDYEEQLQLPNKLSCTLDLATATGKSYVIYGIAQIMLTEGAVDQVLVLCPSLTIEDGLKSKFKDLASDISLKGLLPDNSKYKNPHIISGNESIVPGSICVENFHATLQHVNSSIRDSLRGRGNHTLIINDETHHVYNRPFGRDSNSRGLKKWKEFLLDNEFGFHFIVGLSGTCYIDNEYFNDVIYRYSLRTAMENGFVKLIEYVAEDSSESQNEKFQKIYNNHFENNNIKYRKVKPLTIIVTRDISSCKQVTRDLIKFLAEKENITNSEAEEKVLIVTSANEHRINLMALKDVDRGDLPIEWITSVSMLTEGWDVENVFQIVPHEERAFNSKLLISQVLGRGLRIPKAYQGEKPVVTVFNHDNWSSKIKNLVNEVIEYEKRIYSYPVEKSPDYNFYLHQINYQKDEVVEEFDQHGEYDFSKNYIKLASQASNIEKITTYERATDSSLRSKVTLINNQMHTVESIVESISFRLRSIDMETEGETNYEEKFYPKWLKSIIVESLRRIGEENNIVSEDNRQRILRAFGTLHRGSALRVRYSMTPNSIEKVQTSERQRDSVGYATLRRGEVSVFADENSFTVSDIEDLKVLNEIKNDEKLLRLTWNYVSNTFLFKTPLNIVFANHKPEREFIKNLIKPDIANIIDSWIKSTDREFYPIEYAWKKGDHSKRQFFNPDFFIKIKNDILVIEIKGDEELYEPSDENKGKFNFAINHFSRLNQQQSEINYFFHFLTPKDFDLFFSYIKQGKQNSFRSNIDLALS